MGLINKARAKPDASADIDPQSVREGMKLPPQLKGAYDKVVLAGMKVMFSQQTHQEFLKEIQGDDLLANRVGKTIAGLMMLLFAESNKTMPQQVMIPAGTELVVQAIDFIQKSGLEPVTNKDVGDAVQVFINLIMKQTQGAQPQQAPTQPGQPQTPQPSQQPAAPQAAPAQPVPQGA